jgi:hypothetical protein
MTTATQTLNSLLLYDRIKWAEAGERLDDHPSWGHWGQGSWAVMNDVDEDLFAELNLPVVTIGEANVCRTSHCIAGSAVVEAGYRLIYSGEPDRYRQSIVADDCIEQYDTGLKDLKGQAIWLDVPGARQESIGGAGARVLGLSEEEADLLFDGDNDVDDLMRKANMFCANRRLPLLFPDEPIWDPRDDDEPDDF